LDEDQTTAIFTHVAGRKDSERCKKTIENFVKKINNLAKSIGVGLKLQATKESVKLIYTGGTSNETPLTVKNIPSLILHVCKKMKKKIEVQIQHETCIYNPKTGRCNKTKT
jgi:uncharacterized FlaG/YvyC family protein